MSSRGVNKVIIVGNVGQDPEVRYMPNGNAVANLTVATSDSWKDQQGQQQEKTEWHRVVIFGKLAEVCGEYVRKGSQLYLEGKLETRKWKDQSGADKYTTEIKVDSFTGVMQMLGSTSGSSGKTSAQQSRQAPQQAQQATKPQQSAPQARAPRQAPQRPTPNLTPQQNTTPELDDGWDDDIPF